MDFTWLFIQMLIVLVVVCAGAVLFLRYVLPKMAWAKKWQKTGLFELVDRFGIDHKRTVYLLKVGGRYLLLGGSEQSLSLLRELEEKDVEEKK